jgi:drug/metabolite transporter (DMT)-like permease
MICELCPGVNPAYHGAMDRASGISTRQANLLLLLASAIWGLAFVAQRVGMRHVEPFLFNGVRFALAAVALTPLLVFGLPGRSRRRRSVPRRRILRGGLLAGCALFAGSTLQQYGVVFTTAGKAGFITSLYVVFVPVLGLVVGQRTGRHVWGGVAACAAGLYLLSARGLVGIGLGDGLVLIGAVFWALHVLVIGHLARELPALPLAVAQFAVVAVLSLAGAAVFETFAAAALGAAAVPILYAGLMSVAVAYTLQVLGQTRAKPAHAAIILSLESVFAALGGWAILGESLDPRGIFGCGLMLAGVLLAQLGPESRQDVVAEPVGVVPDRSDML